MCDYTDATLLSSSTSERRCPICIVRKGSINSPWIRETNVYRYDQRRHPTFRMEKRRRMNEIESIPPSFLVSSCGINKMKNERRKVSIDSTHRRYLLCWNCTIVGRSFQSLEEDWFYNSRVIRECFVSRVWRIGEISGKEISKFGIS